MDWARLPFSFRGRINRVYWGMLVADVAVLILGLIGAGRLGNTDSPSLSPAGQIVMLGVAIVVLASALAVGAKRLHDRDKSAWWLLLFYGVTGALLGIGIAVDVAHDTATHCLLVSGWVSYNGGTCPPSWPAIGLCLAGLAVGVWSVVELGCLGGTAGANRFGPGPLPRQYPEDAGAGEGNGR